MTKTLHRLDDGSIFEADDDAFDSNGCLKDGYTLRVPKMFRDSKNDPPRFRDSPHPVGSRPGFITTDASEKIRREAYLDSVRELRDAWRTDASKPDQPPPGAEARIGSPGHREGDACTVRAGGVGEGGPGRLVREGDWLVCRPVSAAVTPDSAHKPQPLSIADAQKIRDAAYAEFVSDMQNAWKT
jgi:hypothetical protein